MEERMSQSTLPLPLAEKTNIKDWSFFDLNLGNTAPLNIDATSLVPQNAKNAIVLVDGVVAHKVTEPAITITETATATIKEKNSLTELNNVNKNSQLSINIDKGAVISEPLYIVHAPSSRSLVHQAEVTVGDSAQVEIVESFISDTKINANIVSKLNIGKNANVTSTVINRLNGESTVYYHRLNDVADDGVLKTYNFVINNSNLVFEDFTHLTGKASEADVATVSLATETQKQNFTIRVENYAPRSLGNILNYGIVKDTAHLAFNGIGKIHKDMKGVDNQQETRLMNLSRKAEAVANPFLLIDEGDITAGHAASIGQIDEEQIYYLMSRGLSREESEKLIISGFLAPFVRTVADETMQNQLKEIIEEKLA
jgi:Fe-S cluster assembly protein SufD